jgi:hypothetical protein
MLPGAFAAAAEPKLFYTPAERARVTLERRAMLASEAVGSDSQFVSSIAPANALAVPAGPPRLEGVSLPQGGRAHAWIGGRRYEDGELYQGRRVRVMRDGVQLASAGGSGRLYRVGEIMQGASRQ